MIKKIVLFFFCIGIVANIFFSASSVAGIERPYPHPGSEIQYPVIALMTLSGYDPFPNMYAQGAVTYLPVVTSMLPMGEACKDNKFRLVARIMDIGTDAYGEVHPDGDIKCTPEMTVSQAIEDAYAAKGIIPNEPTYAMFNANPQRCLNIYNGVNMYSVGCTFTIVNPTNNHCEFDSVAELNFDHGSLSQSEINNNVVRESVSMTCSANVSVTFSLSGNMDSSGGLTLANNLHSKIQISGKTLTETGVSIELKKGDNPMEVTSTLVSTGAVDANSYNASGTIVALVQ